MDGNLVTVNLKSVTSCIMREQSDRLAAGRASQGGRTMLREAIAQRSAVQQLVDNILQPNSRVCSVYQGTSLLKTNFDLHFFIFQEMRPLSVEADKMEVSATSAGDMMEQGG